MSGPPLGVPHEEEALGKAYDARLMRRLLGYLRPYRARVVLAILILLVGALIELVGPWLTQIALDRAIPQRDGGLLGLLALAYFGTLVVGFGLGYVQTVLTTWIGQKVMYDLRRQIFGHLQRLSLPFFDRNPVGRLMTRTTNDVEVLNELFTSGVVTVFGDVFTLAFIVVAMLLMDWRLALVTFAVLPLVVLAAFLFRARIREAYREIRVRLARINAFLQERITGVAVVRLFGREAETNARFREIDRDYLAAHLRSITYYALFFPVMELITAVALAMIVTYGGLQILDGSLTVGVVAAFLQYARRFFRPIQDLSEKYNMLQGAMASSERIFKLLDTDPAASRAPAERLAPENAHAARHPAPLPAPDGARADGAGAEPAPAAAGARPAPARARDGGPRGEIEFRDVWFAYQRRPAADGASSASEGATAAPDGAGAASTRTLPAPDPSRPRPNQPGAPPPPSPERQGAGEEDPPWDWVLKGVSFRARPGERVAVVGHTGAGKTTLINLLMRFYEPQRGQILFDGVPIRDIPLPELRRRIGLVLQDVFLFSRDVAYNIRLGRDDIDDERIRAAAARVGADRFIARLPRGYAEPLGERGSTLSVGERQLLSFARALAFDPLVLVLDEATSSVDSELEAQIERALDTLMRGRTSLVIAHRLSTIQGADRILVLHHGELREQGTHQELLARGGLYARLHQLQFASAGA